MIKTYSKSRIKRHARIRSEISGTAGRPRLSVFRSSAHIYAQLIDDEAGKTLAQASDVEVKDKMTKTDKAKLVGENIALAAKKAKVKKVVFDRGGFSYHGRVKALADQARAGGLEF
ncbi:MAG TPA: 50S ribosomal protein L18 [Patescibacteria group bacterium]|nr:50S ribosomal protein L18 [Patescibacteria group bacterium]